MLLRTVRSPFFWPIYYSLVASFVLWLDNKTDYVRLQGVSVFNYLNDDVIQILMGGINRDLRADMNLFDTFYNQDVTIPQKFTIVESLWVYFINFWATRMENRHRAYFSRRINELLTPWQDVLDGNPSPATQQIAEQAMEDIRLVADLYAEIRFEKRNLT